MPPSVSILLLVKNERPNLEQSFDLIQGQDYDGDVEIVCVDSGSTDGTVAFMRERGVELVDARRVLNDEPAIFQDASHISSYGHRKVAELLREQISRMLGQKAGHGSRVITEQPGKNDHESGRAK